MLDRLLMYSIDDYREVVKQFEAVLAALDKLCKHIEEKLIKYPIWVNNEQGGFIANRTKAIEALQYLTFVSGLQANETYTCPGVVGATKQTVSLIERVNQAKDDFKSASQAYLAKQPMCPNHTKLIRRILTLSGYPRISLKHAYRHLTCLSYHPRRIAWTRAKSGSHVIINRLKAQELLLKAGQGKHIDVQLDKLKQLRKGERLVIFHEIKHGWYVNVSNFKSRAGHTLTKKIRCALPIFYLHNENLPTPEVCFSSKMHRDTKSHRVDKKIQDIPFLDSINAYRYVL